MNKRKNDKTPDFIKIEIFNHNGNLIHQEILISGMIYFYGMLRIKQQFNEDKKYIIKTKPGFNN
jgi:hypothetical protein